MTSAICCGMLASCFDESTAGGAVSLAAARSAGTFWHPAAASVKAAIEQKAIGKRFFIIVAASIASSVEVTVASRSAEREREDLHAGIQKFNLELPVCDGLRLPDQLIQPGFDHCAASLVVHIQSMHLPGRLSIDEHAEAHGCSRGTRAHDEVQIASVKTVYDSSAGLVQCRRLFPQGPITRKRPLVQLQLRRNRVDTRRISCCPTR